MELFPIVSWADFVNGVISSAIVVYLWRFNDGTHRPGLWSFIGFYSTLAVFWFFFAVPEIILVEAYSITVMRFLGYAFFFLSLIFLLQIPFLFIGRRLLGYVSGIVVAIIAITFFIQQIVYLTLDERIVIPPYVFWREDYTSWFHLLPGLAALFASITFIAVMLHIAWRETATDILRWTASYLAGGMALLTVSATIYFVVTDGGFGSSLISAGLAVIGLFVVLRGVIIMQRAKELTEE